VLAYDPGAGTGRMLALDLDVSHADVNRDAAELAQLTERLGTRCVADVSLGGRHVHVLFSSSLPWPERRDGARVTAPRFPAVDPAPTCSLGGQISALARRLARRPRRRERGRRVLAAHREAVDQRYAELTAAVYPGRQPPFEAFWGARYAIVTDPDGNDVGLMSPIDESRRTWPPGSPGSLSDRQPAHPRSSGR
jgi:hypothetical protein